jgi:hypothetical protein
VVLTGDRDEDRGDEALFVANWPTCP